MMRKEEMILDYQPYVDYNPSTPKELYSGACSADTVTIDHWKKSWKKNIKENHDHYKSFADHSIGKIFGLDLHKPVIIAGAGPSLKHNILELRNRRSITLVSCLHNFHFMEDNGADVDYYVSLDAGEVTIEEVTEGGTKTDQEYWDLTKKRKLLCYIGTHPELLKRWQGEIYFFNAPIPDQDMIDFVDNLEIFNAHVSNGGNVLGACLYIAKAILGASVVAFVGADFSFSYSKKFHPFDSKYDAKLGHVIRAHDVFGNLVSTWQSYYNFKSWFEYVAITVPGIYFNCSEGGCLGAYTQGNIRSITQMTLKSFLKQITMSEEIKEQMKDPKTKEKKLLF